MRRFKKRYGGRRKNRTRSKRTYYVSRGGIRL